MDADGFDVEPWQGLSILWAYGELNSTLGITLTNPYGQNAILPNVTYIDNPCDGGHFTIFYFKGF